MKKCAIYARNTKLDPSGFYRIGQYIEHINVTFIVHNLCTDSEFSKNLQIKNLFLKKLYQGLLYVRMLRRVTFFFLYDYFTRVDSIFVQRTMLPRMFPIVLLHFFKKISRNKSIIWDFDDNIIESGEISKKEKNFLAENSTTIIVTSEYLKATLPEQYKEKVILLPTTDFGLSSVYNESIIKEREITYNNEVNIIWIGTGGNLKFLAGIIQYLDEVALQLKEKKKLNLYIICNIPFSAETKKLSLVNIKWSRDIVFEYIKKSHIGIMPLEDNYYTKGKAGFKLVQYMASGLPVIGSHVGYNSNVVDTTSGLLVSTNNPSDWVNCLLRLADDAFLWKSLSFGARKKFMKDFNPQKNIEILNSSI